MCTKTLSPEIKCDANKNTLKILTYIKAISVTAIQNVVKFYVQVINYNDISEAANSHCSHLVVFRSRRGKK